MVLSWCLLDTLTQSTEKSPQDFVFIGQVGCKFTTATTAAATTATAAAAATAATTTTNNNNNNNKS